MSENIIADFDLWLGSVAAGFGMAFAYDFLRLFRRLLRHGRLAVDLEDLLYWTLCFFASFTLLYYGNNGVIRFVAVLGAAVGMLLYSVSVGRLFVKCAYFLINKTVGNFCRLLCKIVRRLHKIIGSASRNLVKLLKNVGIFNKIQKILQYRLTRGRHSHKIIVNRDFFTAKSFTAAKRERSGADERGRKKKKNARISARKK